MKWRRGGSLYRTGVLRRGRCHRGEWHGLAGRPQGDQVQMVARQTQSAGGMEFKAGTHEKLPIQLYTETISDGYVVLCSNFIHSCFICSWFIQWFQKDLLLPNNTDTNDHQGLECLLCAVPSLDSGGAGAQRGWVTSLRSHSWDSNPRLLPASSLRVTVKLHKVSPYSDRFWWSCCKPPRCLFSHFLRGIWFCSALPPTFCMMLVKSLHI